jgi:hypothetical protein
MNTILSDPVELRRRGFEVLVHGLGWVNAVRFLRQYETSRLDYARERDQCLPAWDAETLLQKLREKAATWRVFKPSRSSKERQNANLGKRTHGPR